MLDQTNSVADGILASEADIAGLLAQLAGSTPLRSAQRRRDQELARAALANLLSSKIARSEPAPAPPAIADFDRTTTTRRIAAQPAIRVRQGVPAETKRATSAADRRRYCKCGACKWCDDNARWER